MKLLVKTLGFAAGLLLSGTVSALGLGNINVTSSLGEPLKASIGLVAAGKSSAGLSAQLASPDVFKGAGMDYPSSLPKLKFTIESRANGEPYIRLSTDQAVNDPFVSILVELSFPSGRLLREYTFLLDPPGFRSSSANTTVPNDVNPIEPMVETAQAVAAETAAPVSTIPVAAAQPHAPPQPVATPPAAEKKADKQTAPSGSNVASGAIEVRRGDTLSEIASDIRPPGVSLERMLVALYRANAGSFDDGNMNRLRTGKILRQPGPEELAAITQGDAVQEIRAQTTDWDAYRQKLASAAAPSAQTEGGRETSGKISTTVADKAPAVKEGAQEVVRLSKGETAGNKAGSAQAAQDRIHALEEEAIARDKQLKESNERIAALEKNIREMQRLLELKNLPVPEKPSAAPQTAHPIEAPLPVPASAPVAASAVAADATSAVAAASAVAAPKKPAKQPVIVQPPSLLDEILGEPLYLGGIAAALLALVGGLVFARRKKAGTPAKAEKEQAQGDDSNTDFAATPAVVAASETGDFTQPAEAAAVAAATTEDVDPISEAELFLSFGRDVQAEEILKDALQKDPTNNRARLNLLTIYENRQDAASFDAVARSVQESGDAAAWARTAEMGRRLKPEDPLYSNAGTAPTATTTAEAPAASLDFDIGLEATEEPSAEKTEKAVAEPPASSPSFDIPLDLPAAEATPAASPEPPADLDFDLGSLAVPAPETSAPAPQHEESAGDASIPPAATTPQEDAPAENGGALDFALDFPVEQENKEPADAIKPAPEAMALPDVSLTLDDTSPAPAEQAHDAHWHDVATKLDLAKAYQEMGDSAGAREILEEVMNEGDVEQKAAAQAMLAQLP